MRARELRAGALVQPLDRRQRAADEQRLQHHVVPAVIVEMRLRIRIAVRDRLEHHAHVGAQALADLRFERCRVRVERQAPVQRRQFGDIRRAAERPKAPGERRASRG
jgi:hypothetical protein